MDKIKVDFSQAKVGDPAWHITLGECSLLRVEMDADRPYVWESKLWDSNVWTTGGGKLHSNDFIPTVWPSQPVIIQQPEDEVTEGKVLVRWVNVYRGDSSIRGLYDTENSAKSVAGMGATQVEVKIPLPGKVVKKRWKRLDGVVWQDQPGPPYQFSDDRGILGHDEKRAILLIAEDVEYTP